MSIRNCVLLGTLALASSCTHLPPSQMLIGPVTMNLRRGQLPSGAQVVIEEARGTGTVAVALIVGGGPLQDPKGKEGAAQLLARLAFHSKPTGRVTQSQAYELLGVQSCTSQVFPSDSRLLGSAQVRLLPQLVGLMAQQIALPLEQIDPTTFEQERDALQVELNLESSRGLARLADQELDRALYPPGHRFAGNLGGTPETVAGLTLADLQTWAAAHYRPENVTLVITGDFDAAAMEPVVVAALPDAWKNHRGNRPYPQAPFAPPNPPPRPAQVPVAHAPVQRNSLALAWSLPPLWTSDAPPQFLTARLERALNNTKTVSAPDAEPASCHVHPGPEVTLMICQVQLKTGDQPDATLAALTRRLDGVWSKEFVVSRLGAVNSYLAQLHWFEDVRHRASARAEGLHYTGEVDAMSKYLDQVRRLDPDALIAFGRDYLGVERMRAVMVAPAPPKQMPAPRHSSPSLDALDAQVPAAAIREEAEGPSLVGLRTFTLANGLKVMVVPRPAMPIATVALVIPGGTDRGALGAPYVADLYTTRFERIVLGPVESEHLTDVTLVRFDGGNGNIENLLAQAGVWTQLDAKNQKWEEVLAALRERLEQARLNPELREVQDFETTLFRGSRAAPFGYALEDVATITLEQTEAWRAGALQPSQAMLMISGDVDPLRMRDLAEQYLGKWAPKGPPLPLAAAPSFEKKPIALQVNGRPGAGTVELQLGCIMPPPTLDQWLAPGVLANALHTRLNRRWRDELSATSRVEVESRTDLVVSSLQIAATVDPNRLTEVLRALKEQLADEAKLPGNELDLARWKLARARSTAGATAAEVAGYFAAPAVRTQDPMGAVSQHHHLAELSSPSMQQAFDVCKGTAVLRLAGDKDLIRAALADSQK